jgi:hypothetical protein
VAAKTPSPQEKATTHVTIRDTMDV